jgi:hypothetical protein
MLSLATARGATCLAQVKQNELDYFTLDEIDYEPTNAKSDQEDELAYDVACTYDTPMNAQPMNSASAKSMELLLRCFGTYNSDDICIGVVDSNGAKLSLNSGK